MAPAQFLIVWTEVEDENSRIAFQWNGRPVLVEDAFIKLHTTLERAKVQRKKVVIIIHGRLGQNVRWESTISAMVRHETRKVFRSWFTQAVQAQAAVVRQRVLPPAFH